MTFWEALFRSDWDTLMRSDRFEVAIAGVVGSAVHVAMEWQGWPSGVRRLFVGFAAALFMSPVGVPLFKSAFSMVAIPPDQAAGFGGFVTGVAGVIILEIFLNFLKLMRREKRLPHDDER